MTTTLASTPRVPVRSSVRTRARTGTRKPLGAAPLARPVLGAPVATPSVRPMVGRPGVAASCRVSSPAALRVGLVLKVKVVAIAVLAIVGAGVSTAEFASWSQTDPSVDYVAGDPAWAHVTGR